ncbi:hypothetical protein H5185_08535 [Shewanella sp. SG44-6]|jgi:hypothetical protein|uniref:hypothetical protein n=1 Tax=Shewanella sp. SG44-6 TaxID=2760959 RepID=UPI0015FF0826|nr:hypothetical protein [Shewanella sp. SG44-6]MBB1389467.1 hypothetical protein [Shewanella sp. SG44-6]
MSINITKTDLDFIIANFTQIRSTKLINGIHEYYFNVRKYANASKLAGVDRKSIRINVIKINDIVDRLEQLKDCADTLEEMTKKHFDVMLTFAPTHKDNIVHNSALTWHKNLKFNNDSNIHLLLAKKRSFDDLINRTTDKLKLVKLWHSMHSEND